MLAVAVQEIVPLPFSPPVTLNQLWLLLGVQFCVQPAGVPVTVIVPLLAPAGMMPGDAMVRSVQGTATAPAWVTVMPVVFVRTAADREFGDGFEVADHVNDPAPSPLPETVSQSS